MIDIINEIVGDTPRKFEKWIMANQPKDYNSPYMSFIINNNLLEDYKLFLIKNHFNFFFPNGNIRYGMITDNIDLYNLIFRNKMKFDWVKATKKLNKWLEIQKKKPKVSKNNVGIFIDEWNMYFVLYKKDSILCKNLSKILYSTLENIKNKIDPNLFEKILKEKIFEMFYHTDISFTDSLNELLVLNYYLNKGYKLTAFNVLLESGKDLDFEVEDINGNKICIEVVNKHITQDKSSKLKNYIESELFQKYRYKITTKNDMSKNIIICQTLTPNYSNFNDDLIELQEIYKTPFNLNFEYNTFCFFVSEDKPCFISLKDNNALIDNNLLQNVKLIKGF